MNRVSRRIFEVNTLDLFNLSFALRFIDLGRLYCLKPSINLSVKHITLSDFLYDEYFSVTFNKVLSVPFTTEYSFDVRFFNFSVSSVNEKLLLTGHNE